jgi:hypothetical protein
LAAKAFRERTRAHAHELYERTHKAEARERPPTAKLAKPAGGWDEDFVVNQIFNPLLSQFTTNRVQPEASDLIVFYKKYTYLKLISRISTVGKKNEILAF